MTEPNNPLPSAPARRTHEELAAIVREKLIEAMTPGRIVEFDPEEAEYAGAFIEDAMSEEDALAAMYDPRNDD
ncbi:MAG: hypothetical protein ABWY08_18695 [Comamonas sp.]